MGIEVGTTKGKRGLRIPLNLRVAECLNLLLSPNKLSHLEESEKKKVKKMRKR
jgi:hypothetical protein